MPPEALYIIGLLLLASAFAYGFMRSRKRNKANDSIREEAVRQSYDDPKGYEHGGEQRLRDRLKSEN